MGTVELIQEARHVGLELAVKDGKLAIKGKVTPAASAIVRQLTSVKAAVVECLSVPADDADSVELTAFIGQTISVAEWNWLQGLCRQRHGELWTLKASQVDEGFKVTGLTAKPTELG